MDNGVSIRQLNCGSYRFVGTDDLRDDITITKFLNLLLKYSYKWFPNDQLKLNLTETEKERFIQECSESIDPINELNAVIVIEIIKDYFDQELSRLEECSKKDSGSEIPWWSVACQIFPHSSTPEEPPISCTSTSLVATASNIPPPSVLNLKTTHASSSTIDSSSSAPNVQQFSCTTLLPSYGQPPFCQEKHLANPSTTSSKAVYDTGFFSKNVVPQYDFPILYPVCILPQFSLGRLRGSGFSCTQNENVTLFDNSMPVDLSSFDRINSYRPDNRHSSRTNSYHPYNHQPDRRNSNRHNCHNQMIKQGRNASQSDTSIKSIKSTATGHISIQNSIVKEYENSANNYFSRESFLYSTTGTTSTVFRDMPSSSSFSAISRPTFTNIFHSSFLEASTPSARVSISQACRNSTTPIPINSLPRPTLTNTGHSSFREASTPSARVSISQAYRDSTTPNPINFLPRPTLTNIGHSSLREASTPSARVSILQTYLDSPTPNPKKSLPRPTLNNVHKTFRKASTPSSKVSISQKYRDSTALDQYEALIKQMLNDNSSSSFCNASTPLSSKVSISQACRDSTTPNPINSIPRPTLTNIGHSSFREASTSLSSSVSISQAEGDSLPGTVNWSHQLTVGSSLPSSTTVVSKGEKYLNTNTTQ